MPALQVRDFPDDLYEDLKKYAAREHRSMAQQTIKAVEEMLQREGESSAGSAANVLQFDTLAERQRRSEKRQALFERMNQCSKNLPDHISDAAQMIRDGRDERDEQLCEVLGIPATVSESETVAIA